MNRSSGHTDRCQLQWLDADAGDLEQFMAEVGQTTNLGDWPLAAAVEQNALVYNGEDVRRMAADRQSRRELMAEWGQVFSSGPGILAIRQAFADSSVLDTASELFTRLIDAQRASGAASGDHFAKPGANDRIWNSLQKHAEHHPRNFCEYYANESLALASEAWLGPGYQVTAQVNRVNPGGTAQTAHRDYHLGFMAPDMLASMPRRMHHLSPLLTLQGAIAHCDMPLETGPTLYLPYSHNFEAGYVAATRPEFQTYFDAHCAQIALHKGDVVFFNPAVYHAAGNNQSADVYRLANLLQVSSPLGRATETVDRVRLATVVYPYLLEQCGAGVDGDLPASVDRVVAASAEGYAFPTNLDLDPPVGGMAPATQAAMMRDALRSGLSAVDFEQRLLQQNQSRRA